MTPTTTIAAITAVPFKTKHAAHMIPQAIMNHFDEAEELFLHSDFAVVSEFAVRTGVPDFIAGASLPLEAKKEILQARQARWINEYRNLPTNRIEDYLLSLDEKSRQAILTGKTPLHEWDCAAANFNRLASDERGSVLSDAKTAFFNMMRGMITGAEYSANHPRPVPSVVVIRHDGSIGFFRNQSAAKEYARELGGMAFVGNLAMQTVGFTSFSDSEITRMIAERREQAKKPAAKK